MEPEDRPLLALIVTGVSLLAIVAIAIERHTSHGQVAASKARAKPKRKVGALRPTPRRKRVSDSKKRIFVGFAIEDEKSRNMLRGQSRLGDSPIEYIDYSVKEPWSSSWKTQCRQRIKSCDGMIAMLSTNTKNADGARWEIKCAVEENVPLLGVHIHTDDLYKPSEIEGKKVILWTWPGIASFINKL